MSLSAASVSRLRLVWSHRALCSHSNTFSKRHRFPLGTGIFLAHTAWRSIKSLNVSVSVSLWESNILRHTYIHIHTHSVHFTLFVLFCFFAHIVSGSTSWPCWFALKCKVDIAGESGLTMTRQWRVKEHCFSQADKSSKTADKSPHRPLCTKKDDGRLQGLRRKTRQYSGRRKLITVNRTKPGLFHRLHSHIWKVRMVHSIIRALFKM